MESKRTHEELKEILDRNTAWIENCDSKTSIILGSFGVIAGIFLATDYVSKFKGILCHMTSNVFFVCRAWGTTRWWKTTVGAFIATANH